MPKNKRRPLYGGRGLKFLIHIERLKLWLSPSIRRAWIEIILSSYPRFFKVSPSIRRAWIEILDEDVDISNEDVALYTEGVD